MIINKTKNIVVSQDELVAKSSLAQSRGLMFRTTQNCLMIFSKERFISLHNFFVFYPLDILIINEQNIIVEIKQNFRPFTLWSSTKKGKYCLELAYPSVYDVGDNVEITYG